MATWRSGDATVCKTVYPGSIPGVASKDGTLGDDVGPSSHEIVIASNWAYVRELTALEGQRAI
jgi:hypothetical protein